MPSSRRNRHNNNNLLEPSTSGISITPLEDDTEAHVNETENRGTERPIQRTSERSSSSGSSPSRSLSPQNRKPLSTQDFPKFDKRDIEKWLHKIEWLFLVYYVNKPIERIQLIAPLLPSSVISQIQRPITENTYEEVKKVLRSTYAPSARERVADLFQHKLKPSEKPSEYLNRIRLSLGDSPFESMIQNNETVAKEMFLQVLPDDTAAMLEVLTVDLSIYKMAEVADKYMSRRSRIAANHYRNESVNAIAPFATRTRELTPPPSISSLAREVAKLTTQVAEVIKKIDDLSTQSHKMDIRLTRLENSQTRGYSRGRSASRYRPEGALCYYHFKFRERASRCQGGNCRWAAMQAQSSTSGHSPSTTQGNES